MALAVSSCELQVLPGDSLKAGLGALEVSSMTQLTTVVEVTIDVLFALISFSSFFSAFIFALQVSMECLVFPQNVHFSSS